MKKYLKKHYKFLIIILILLSLFISSSLFIIISKTNDKNKLNETVDNLTKYNFTNTHETKKETIKSSYTFEENGVGKKIIKKMYTEKNKDDEEISYDFTYEEVKDKNDNYLYITVNKNTSIFKIDATCIYEINSPSILYCN